MANPLLSSRVSLFGFNTNPNIVGAEITGGTVYTAVGAGNIPGLLFDAEFCATAGANNCSGGAGDGALSGGQPSPARSRSTSTVWPTPSRQITFSDLFVRLSVDCRHQPRWIRSRCYDARSNAVLPDTALHADSGAGSRCWGASTEHGRCFWHARLHLLASSSSNRLEPALPILNAPVRSRGVCISCPPMTIRHLDDLTVHADDPTAFRRNPWNICAGCRPARTGTGLVCRSARRRWLPPPFCAITDISQSTAKRRA